jgi:hypothetical protein
MPDDTSLLSTSESEHDLLHLGPITRIQSEDMRTMSLGANAVDTAGHISRYDVVVSCREGTAVSLVLQVDVTNKKRALREANRILSGQPSAEDGAESR